MRSIFSSNANDYANWHGNRYRSLQEAYSAKKDRSKLTYHKAQTTLDKCWPNRYAIKKLLAKYGPLKEITSEMANEYKIDPKIFEKEIQINGQIFYTVGGGYAFSLSQNIKLIVCKI